MSKNILYSNVSSIPDIPYGYFPRPRINKLLAEAIKHPLVAVTAGAGYGKTQAVSSFLHNADLPYVWCQLSSLDNLTTRFWESFVYAVAIQNPYIAGRLATAGFPYSEAQFDDFLHKLSEAVAEIGRIIFVFDDYYLIEEPTITHFFKNFLSARLKNLTIILISRDKISLNIPGEFSNKLVMRISEEDLRFTLTETGDYFKTQGILIADQDLHNIHTKTEGWISAVYLIGMSLKRSKAVDTVMARANQKIFALIEDEIFSRYTSEVQELLINLSVLGDFSLELLKELVDLNIILEISKTNTFIYFDPVTRDYRFHNLFLDFLSEKLIYMQENKIKETSLKIADWYAKRGSMVDALIFYEKCDHYNEMCEILCGYKIDIPLEESNLFLGMIDRVPEKIAEKHPLIRVVHARLLLNNGDAKGAANELHAIRDTYESLPDTAENNAILGETYIFQAFISLLERNLDFVKLFKMADACLPNGSVLSDNGLYLNNGNISVTIEKPVEGEVRRFEEAMETAALYASRVMHGCCYGTDFLTKAEAAYYRDDRARAEGNAFKAIYRAQQKGQNDILCCAYFILMRLSIADGSYEKASGFLEELQKKLSDSQSTDFLHILDIFSGWFYVRLGDTGKVANWIKSDDLSASVISPNSAGLDRFVRVYYLMQNESYHELSAYLEFLEEVCNSKGFLLTKLQAQILKSIVAYKTGDSALSASALKEAYSLAHANSLIMPFIEEGSNMRAVIDAALRQGGHGIPEDWLNSIRGKANTYAKKLSNVVEQYHALHGEPSNKQHSLTSREVEILRCLCQGFNRDEIAKSLYVSPNTVKSSLQNIYSKLGAANKADAVRIAIRLGLDH